MREYASSRVKRKSFYRKSGLQMFLLPAAILVHQNGVPIWRLHFKLYKGARNVSVNNSETVGLKDLRLGEIVCILVFYNISFFLPSSTGRFPIHFLVPWQWKRSTETRVSFMRTGWETLHDTINTRPANSGLPQPWNAFYPQTNWRYQKLKLHHPCDQHQ